jgi:hypothetical protein
MKTKIASLFIAFCATHASQAVIVQYSTTFAQAVTTSSANPLTIPGALIPDQGGFTGVGYFTIADSAIPTTSATDLATAFRVFGASGVFGISQIGGVYQNVAGGGRVGAASEFLGKNIYVFNTNAATIAGSSQGLVFKSTQTFTNDSALPVDSEFVVDLGTSGSYVFGGIAGPNLEIAPDFSVPTVQMVAFVPEPSAALLGAVGALGLLRRRRN